MACNLLLKVLNSEINLDLFKKWLENHEISLENDENPCSQTEFVTYFLNFVHKQLNSNEKIGGNESNVKQITETQSNLHKSQTFPTESSTNQSTTPKHRQKLCLGDFITSNKRLSSKKKAKSDEIRRIKPTITNNRTLNLNNSFNFTENCRELPNERRFWTKIEPCFKSTDSVKLVKSTIITEDISDLNSVTYRSFLDKTIEIYNEILQHNYVLNVLNEIYFLISLLLMKSTNKTRIDGVNYLDRDCSYLAVIDELFESSHNLTYFSAKMLEKQMNLIELFDRNTINLLLKNENLRNFVPEFVNSLEIYQKSFKVERLTEMIECGSDVINFNLDRDNRENFINDQSFHAFGKQRDLFYEILKLWETQHLQSYFNFNLNLSGKIYHLLTMISQSINFVHFCRLFKLQLLNVNNVNNNDINDEEFFNGNEFFCDLDREKFLRLNNRLINKQIITNGINELPKFYGNEEFFKDFILYGANCNFNRFLIDCFINEINELSNGDFVFYNEFNNKEDIDPETRKTYQNRVKSLRILAKFLGFIESLPYKTDCIYSDCILLQNLKIRQEVKPNFDIKTILETSVQTNNIILCVPWLVKYLAMLDYVTLRLPYYKNVIRHLFKLYKTYKTIHKNNYYLIKFLLGWLFGLSHFPTEEYYINDDLHFCQNQNGLDNLNVINQNLMYFCCPFLNEIKQLLLTNTINNNNIKHIRPTSTLPLLASRPDLIKEKLEKQIELEFFRNQPMSIKQTSEFVCERLASLTVKFLCNTFIPTFKKQCLTDFQCVIQCDFDEDPIKLQEKSNKIIDEHLVKLKMLCLKETNELLKDKIDVSIKTMLSMDCLEETKDLVVFFTRQMCLKRVKIWIDGHVKPNIFTREFNDEIQKLLGLSKPKIDKPKFLLPSGGNGKLENLKCTSAAHILEKIQMFCISLLEDKIIESKDVNCLINETMLTLSEGIDVNECIISSICHLFVELFLLLMIFKADFLEDIKGQFVKIWRYYYRSTEDLFRFLVCVRNVKIIGQSDNVKETWKRFAKNCAFLLKEDLLSSKILEEQCLALFRKDWDKETLGHLVTFLQLLGKFYVENGGKNNRFAFILDFLSDYCEEM